MATLKPTFSAYRELVQVAAENLDVKGIEAIRDIVGVVIRRSGTIFVAANGGGATLVEHFALGLGLNVLREAGSHRCGRAVALTSGVAVTAAMNDFGPRHVFAMQLATQGRQGDLLFVFSGGGRSKNLVSALALARELRMLTIALVGRAGPVSKGADVSLEIGTSHSSVAEDVAAQVLHWVYCSFMPKGIA